MTLPKSTIDTIINTAREQALTLVAEGTHGKDAAAWLEAEIRARIKGEDNGWSEKKIQKRANWRYYSRAAWRAIQKLPLPLIAQPAIAAGNLVEKMVDRLRKQYTE